MELSARMSTIYWLTREQISEAVNSLSSCIEKAPNPIVNNILKELGVAQARAESSRILGIRFKKSIGKTNNHIPVKLKQEEKNIIEQLPVDDTIKGFFNDIHQH